MKVSAKTIFSAVIFLERTRGELERKTQKIAYVEKIPLALFK